MQLRPATIEDAQRLFDWRNDPLTRSMSKSTDAVPWDDHIAWLTRRLSWAAPDLFIAEVDGRSVGTVRWDGINLSYTIAPEERRKGYATRMLQLVGSQRGKMHAHIKPSNIASIKAARAAGHYVQLLSDTP